MNFIYALVDPVSREIRYVGKSRQPKVRLKAHINRAKAVPGSRRCYSWVASLIAQGRHPEMILLEECGDDWEDIERFWISYLRFVGADLTNLRPGGGGEGTLGVTPKGLWRQKLSDCATKFFSDPENRARASEYARQAWNDPDYVRNRTDKMRVISKSAEYRAKQSVAKKNLYATPGYREKMSVAHLLGDHSAGAKRMWENPEYRERQRLARERRYPKKTA